MFDSNIPVTWILLSHLLAFLPLNLFISNCFKLLGRWSSN